MSRQRKESSARTFKIRNDLLDKLDGYSEKTAIPKTAIVEKALEKYFLAFGAEVNKDGVI